MVRNTYEWIVIVGLTVALAGCGSAPQRADAPGTPLGTGISRDTSPTVDAGAFAAFGADRRDFAFALIEQLRDEAEPGDNLVVSPHSISIALAMTYGGARGRTREQLAEALRFSLDDRALHSAFNELDRELTGRSELETDEGETLELDIVNQIWAQRDTSFEEEYLDLLGRQYGAAVRVVDFMADVEAIREAINDWVERKTRGRLADLLPRGSLTDLTRLVLVNAVYFYADWKRPFDKNLTSAEPFTRVDGSVTSVDMMRHDRAKRFLLFNGENTIAVSIPYVGDEISLLAYMPADPDADFSQWEVEFTREDFDAITGGLVSRNVNLHLPAFEDKGGFRLRDTLAKLGMIDAFDASLADFGAMAERPPLAIDDVHHQVFIRVDEEGSEAAAAAATTVMAASAPQQVSFDRPFYYALYDAPTDTILFLGRMSDPS